MSKIDDAAERGKMLIQYHGGKDIVSLLADIDAYLIQQHYLNRVTALGVFAEQINNDRK